MPRAARLLLPLLMLPALSGCLNDPFGLKPEVPGVEIPANPAEPANAEDSVDPDPA